MNRMSIASDMCRSLVKNTIEGGLSFSQTPIQCISFPRVLGILAIPVFLMAFLRCVYAMLYFINSH